MLQFDYEGPSGELLGSFFKDINVPWPALKSDLHKGLVEADQSETSRFGWTFRIGICIHGDSVSQSVEVIAGPWQWIILIMVCPRLLVLGPPPALIVIINTGRNDKCPGSVAKFFYAMLNHSGQVLIASDMDRVGLFDGSECPVSATLWPAIGVQVGMQAVLLIAVQVGSTTKSMAPYSSGVSLDHPFRWMRASVCSTCAVRSGTGSSDSKSPTTSR